MINCSIFQRYFFQPCKYLLGFLYRRIIFDNSSQKCQRFLHDGAILQLYQHLLQMMICAFLFGINFNCILVALHPPVQISVIAICISQVYIGFGKGFITLNSFLIPANSFGMLFSFLKNHCHVIVSIRIVYVLFKGLFKTRYSLFLVTCFK